MIGDETHLAADWDPLLLLADAERSVIPFPSAIGGSGEKVVEDPELPDVYYAHGDGNYYRREKSGRYIQAGAASLTRYLKSLGFSSKVPADALISPKDAILERLETERAVDYAGVLAGHRQGFERIHGRAVLVTEGPMLPEAEAGVWPHLKRFFNSLLGADQEEVFYGHLKLTDQALRAGVPRPGQILIIVGPPNCGKSLCTSLLTHIWGGGVGKPYAALCGKTDFNAELFTSVLQLIDDESPSADPRVRKAFGAGLKTLAMNRDQRCHGKGQAGLTLDPLWRVVVLTNDDVPSLSVLPHLEAGLLDKLLIFKAAPASLPSSGSELEDKVKLWKMLSDEIPAFLHWLQNWTIPAHIGGDSRFGIKSYRNAEIVSLMDGVADEVRVLELIDSHIFDSGQAGVWHGTASALEQMLREASSAMAGKLFFAASSCGTLLGLLATRHPNRVKKGKLLHGTQRWIVYPPNSMGAAAAAAEDAAALEKASDEPVDGNPF